MFISKLSFQKTKSLVYWESIVDAYTGIGRTLWLPTIGFCIAWFGVLGFSIWSATEWKWLVYKYKVRHNINIDTLAVRIISFRFSFVYYWFLLFWLFISSWFFYVETTWGNNLRLSENRKNDNVLQSETYWFFSRMWIRYLTHFMLRNKYIFMS